MAFVSSSVKQRWLFPALRGWENTSWRGAGRSGQALQVALTATVNMGVLHKEGVPGEASGSCIPCNRAAGEAGCVQCFSLETQSWTMVLPPMYKGHNI